MSKRLQQPYQNLYLKQWRNTVHPTPIYYDSIRPEKGPQFNRNQWYKKTQDLSVNLNLYQSNRLAFDQYQIIWILPSTIPPPPLLLAWHTSAKACTNIHLQTSMPQHLPTNKSNLIKIHLIKIHDWNNEAPHAFQDSDHSLSQLPLLVTTYYIYRS